MQTLRFPTRVIVLFAVFAPVLWASPAFSGEADTLQQAIELFEVGNYLDAQELLLGIDRVQLTEEQQAQRDDYLGRVQVATNMYGKALRDFEDAETAIEEGDLDDAGAKLEAVMANEYAGPKLAEAAQIYLDQIEAGQTPSVAAPDPGEVIDEVTPEDAERARVLTGEGFEMLDAGRLAEAERLFLAALSLLPGYPEAQEGLVQARQHAQNASGTRSESLIDRMVREDEIAWQREVANYRRIEATIEEAIAADKYDEANQALVHARQVVESAKQFSDPITKYENLRSQLDALADRVAKAERDFNVAEVARIRGEIEQQRREAAKREEEKRAGVVNSLMKQARQHYKDGDYDAAISVLQQITTIDPKNDPVRWLMDSWEDTRADRLARDYRDQYYAETRDVLLAVEEAKIPWHDQLRYPKNWLELITRPERNRPGQRQDSALLFGALEKPVDVNFQDSPFDEVIERLADAHRLNMLVNWADLEQSGVDPKTPITMRLPREITLKKVLTEVLEQAGGGMAELGYDVRDGVLKIATQDRLDRDTYTAVYDVNDLLMEIPNFTNAPCTDLYEASLRAAKRRQAEVQEEKPWGYGDDDDDEPEQDPARLSRVEKLMGLIQDHIAPESWISRGGSIGNMEEINGQLVVTQNSSSQRRIDDLLSKLREQRAIQIAVEARFITVSSHYLEELGIDIDIVLNSGNAGYDYVPGEGNAILTDPILGSASLLPRTFSRLGFTPAVPEAGEGMTQNPTTLNQPYGMTQFVPQRSGGSSGGRATPIPIQNTVTSLTNPSKLASDIPGSFAGQALPPALSIFGSFLDNIQVDFLVRATQADSRTTVLTAPRLVLFNGQRAWVAVTLQQNFVSTLNPVVATGAVGQEPETDTIDSGAVLDVQATVTADRRYVTMNLRPGVTRLLDLQTLPFSGGGAGGEFGGQASDAFIQIPTLSSQRIMTTVSVPDGGTLLIGGQKLASESEVDAGVPILSKIPILKRVYSSRAAVKDEQTLLMLIKPKIFIQSEQEELAFPTFAGRQ